MMNWFLDNIVGIVGVILGSIITYHVYFLSKSINLRDRLSHRDLIRKEVEKQLVRIRNGSRPKVEIVNSKKYEKYYPHNNDKTKNGYTYMRADLKDIYFDGVGFFSEMPKEVYKNTKGDFYLQDKDGLEKQDFTIYPVGIVPYEWIEYIDLGGDEFSYRPQFFTKFFGPEKFPYKKIVYYKESNHYQEGIDPLDMKWTLIDIKK